MKNYGYLGAIDIDPANVTVDGEPANYVPATELAWAKELQADDGAWRFLKGGYAQGRGAGNALDALFAGAFTVLALYRRTKVLGTGTSLVQKDNPGVTKGFRLRANSGQNLRIEYIPTAGVYDSGYSALTAKTEDKNFHWAGIRTTGTVWENLLDGQVIQTSGALPAIGSNANNFIAYSTLGADRNDLACVLIYNRVLSDSEVRNIMLGKTMPKSVDGLQGYYKFNDASVGASGQCLDHSGQGNHLTYSGAVWETFRQNVVVNGSFDTDTAWTKGAGWTISDGKARRDGTLSNTGIEQAGVFVKGNRYRVDIEADIVSGYCIVFIGQGAQTLFTLDGSNPKKSIELVSGFNEKLLIQGYSFSGTISNVVITDLSGQSGQPYVSRQQVNRANWWERRVPAYLEAERQGSVWMTASQSVPYNAAMNITGDLSYGGWVTPLKPRSGTGQYANLQSGYSTAVGPVGLNFTGRNVTVQFGNLTSANNVSPAITLDKPLPFNKPTHVFVTLKGSAVSLYMNGLLVATSTDVSASHGMASGSWELCGAEDSAKRSIRLFNRALSAAEINELYLTDKYSGARSAEVLGGGPEKLTDNFPAIGITGLANGVTRSVVAGSDYIDFTLSGTFTAQENIAAAYVPAPATGVSSSQGDKYTVVIPWAVTSGTLPATYSAGLGGSRIRFGSPGLIQQSGNAVVKTEYSDDVHTAVAPAGTTIVGADWLWPFAAGQAINVTIRIGRGSLKKSIYSEGLVGEWLCNDLSLNYLKDTGPFGLNSNTLTAGNIMVADSPYAMVRRKRKGWQCQVSSGSKLSNQTQAFKDLIVSKPKLTITGRVKIKKIQNTASTYFGIQVSGAAAMFYCGANSSGNLAIFARSNQGVGAVSVNTTLTLKNYLNKYILLAAELNFTDNTTTIYVDGLPVYSGAIALNQVGGYTDTGLPILFGANSNTQETHVVDDVRIYNRALTPQEHRNLFVDVAPRDGLVAEYLFDGVGENLIANGDFSSSSTGWSGINSPVLTFPGGDKIGIERTSGFCGVEQAITVATGKRYVFSGMATRTSGTGVPVLRVRTESALNGSVIAEVIVSGVVTSPTLVPYSFEFTPSVSGTVYAQLAINTASAVCVFDNISVREITDATKDTSGNNLHLTASGTVTYVREP